MVVTKDAQGQDDSLIIQFKGARAQVFAIVVKETNFLTIPNPSSGISIKPVYHDAPVTSTSDEAKGPENSNAKFLRAHSHMFT